MNSTHQDNPTKLAVSGSLTHGVAERTFDCREDNYIIRSLAVSSPINPLIVRVIDGPELMMFD